MKKQILFFSALLLVAITYVGLKKIDQKTDTYESWLSSEYQKIPAMDYAEAKAVPKMDRPDLAALQNYLMIVDPVEKRVPTERLLKSFETTQTLISQRSTKGTDPLEWEIQPSVMGGRTRAMLWDPNDPTGNKVWGGSVTGGLWYNDNITLAISQWQSVDAFWSNLSVSCITYDPNNTQTFYIGTGEAQTALLTYRESSGVGYGILTSTDGGDTWDWIESTKDWAFVTDVVVRNENGVSVIYAGVASGQYHGVHMSEPTDGLFRSDNGGESWQQVLPNITGLDIPYTPADIKLGADNRIYVGSSQNVNGQGGATILYSDEGTEGSWTVNEDYRQQIEQGMGQYTLPGRVMLATAASDENVVYAIIGGGYIDEYPYYHGVFALRSDNKGESWSSMAKPDNGSWASLSWHAFVISVDPNDPDKVFCGGLDQWKSNNGGNSWNHVSDWAMMYYGGGDDYLHADQHVALYKPGSSSEAIFGTDGGAFYTNNAAAEYPDFQERNNRYNTLQFYSCAIKSTAGSEELLGGLQDNGSLWFDGSPVGINDMVQGGDGGFCFFDENEPNIAYTSVYYNRYNVYVNGNQTNYLNDQIGTFVNPGDLDWKDNIMFNNAVDYSGNNSNKIQLYSNLPNNGNSSYFTINTGSIAYFSAITYSQHSEVGSPTIFVGTNAGQLFKVNNASTSEPQTNNITGAEFPDGSISSIAIGGSEDTLMVTFSNYGVPSVWQSYDGGENWNNIESNLPDMPVRWAIYHPQNSKQVMLATELGIWTSIEASAEEVEWVPDVSGMGNVRVDMLRMRQADNTVVAATHGRGLHTTVWPIDLSVGTNELADTEIKIYPNPATDKIIVSAESTLRSCLLVVRNMNAQEVLRKTLNSNHTTIPLNGLAAGTYIVEISNGETVITKKKIVVQK